MPVYDRRYRGFDGERRPSRWLFLTLTRFGLLPGIVLWAVSSACDTFGHP